METRGRSRIGRGVALLLSAGLIASLGAANLAAGATRSSFVGDFDVVTEGDRQVVWHVTAQTFRPSATRLVPGDYVAKGVVDWAAAEVHAQIAHVDFWFDPNNPAPGLGGSNVAFADGVECVYNAPGDAACGLFAVMFIDDLDPSLPDQVAYANTKLENGDWDFQYWFWVGKGSFQVRIAQ
jgi:hypothetical protein